MIKQTKNCIRCLKPAKFWTGYVINTKTKETIIAGWCSQRCYETSIGFKGLWTEEMGLENDKGNKIKEKNTKKDKRKQDK